MSKLQREDRKKRRVQPYTVHKVQVRVLLAVYALVQSRTLQYPVMAWWLLTIRKLRWISQNPSFLVNSNRNRFYTSDTALNCYSYRFWSCNNTSYSRTLIHKVSRQAVCLLYSTCLDVYWDDYCNSFSVHLYSTCNRIYDFIGCEKALGGISEMSLRQSYGYDGHHSSFRNSDVGVGSYFEILYCGICDSSF